MEGADGVKDSSSFTETASSSVPRDVAGGSGEVGVLALDQEIHLSSSSAPTVHIRADGLTKRFRVAERRPAELYRRHG